MRAIEIKALETSLELLKSITTYPTYSALSEALKDSTVGVRTSILSIFQDKIAIEEKKISDVRGWITVLLQDSKEIKK